jgi:hypothetical protein
MEAVKAQNLAVEPEEKKLWRNITYITSKSNAKID